MKRITNKLEKLSTAFVQESEQLASELKKPRALAPKHHPTGKGCSSGDLMIQRLAVEFNHDPIKEMVKLAKSNGIDDKLKFEINKELLSYIVPKLKAIDTNPNQGEVISIKVITPGSNQEQITFEVNNNVDETESI